jgi:hypothetical protein
MDVLIEHTLILYIRVTAQDEAELIERAEADPKPLYYRPAFLEQQLTVYLEDHGLHSHDEIDPDDFTRWVFPRLFHARVPRYESIAKPYGYTVTSAEISQVRDDKDFLSLLESAIVRCV